MLFYVILLLYLFIYCKSEDWSKDYVSNESYEGDDFKDILYNGSTKGNRKRLHKTVQRYNHTCEAILRSKLNRK